jgi:hypothetical protein
MISRETMYKTKDGQIHTTHGGAINHVLKTIENVTGPMIDTSGIGIRDRMAACAALFGTIERAREVQTILNKML